MTAVWTHGVAVWEQRGQGAIEDLLDGQLDALKDGVDEWLDLVGSMHDLYGWWFGCFNVHQVDSGLYSPSKLHACGDAHTRG